MKTLLLAMACIVVFAAPAFACRGTTEFPQAIEQLKQSTISSERKQELMALLRQGQALHDEGHSQGDMDKLGESLRILDGVLAEIGE